MPYSPSLAQFREAARRGNLVPVWREIVLDGRVQLAPYVERHPLAEINRVLADVHARKIARRAILVPA